MCFLFQYLYVVCLFNSPFSPNWNEQQMNWIWFGCVWCVWAILRCYDFYFHSRLHISVSLFSCEYASINIYMTVFSCSPLAFCFVTIFCARSLELIYSGTLFTNRCNVNIYEGNELYQVNIIFLNRFTLIDITILTAIEYNLSDIF